MSVFDLPRLYFGGTALTRLPTGPRGGLVDLGRNTALRGTDAVGTGEAGQARPEQPLAAGPFGVDEPAEEYHEHLAGRAGATSPGTATSSWRPG
ncbi:hypothetical protein OG259_35255 [Streptomyces sp. NBC_00250]|uniref:hypothetical protein n=1 Tax=Streptomyces sp. NBC_00250 TaxID=2903641 RepID=UPI002E2E1281|nr:hypothetical protein [Streptomyces sp. NBC_00250]